MKMLLHCFGGDKMLNTNVLHSQFPTARLLIHHLLSNSHNWRQVHILVIINNTCTTFTDLWMTDILAYYRYVQSGSSNGSRTCLQIVLLSVIESQSRIVGITDKRLFTISVHEDASQVDQTTSNNFQFVSEGFNVSLIQLVIITIQLFSARLIFRDCGLGLII